MTQDKTLKDTNRINLIIYLVLNFLFFAILSGLTNIRVGEWDDLLSKWLAPGGIIIGILYFISIVLEGLISSDIKAVLVFWRIKNPLPGTRAFSDIAVKDPRIDMNAVRRLFPGKLPEDPKEQNTAWFSLYKKYGSMGNILEVHKAFLLTRDLASLTVVLVPVSLIGYILLHFGLSLILVHLSVLLGLYLVTAISSRNYGNRFVANVLVEAVHQKD